MNKSQSLLTQDPGMTWEIARLFPRQGDWNDGDYLELETNHLVELADGVLEVLPMPTMSHQQIVQHIFALLLAFVSERHAGRVLVAPFRIRLGPKKFREPDLMFMGADHDASAREEYWLGADLVMEVVSDDDESRRRDLETKREEYAQGGIREYWIVDPREQRVIVLELNGNRYDERGRFAPGQRAASALLSGFEVDVEAAFAAGRR